MNRFVQTIPPSAIRLLHDRKRPDAIDLGLGQPLLHPDMAPLEAALAWVREHGCPYSPNPGFTELRAAIRGQRPDAGGYDATDAVTYVWLGQALLMTVALWGGGTTDELPERIRSGQIGVDLYRPIGLLGWYLATDLGRAAFHFLVRGVVPTLVGVALFHIRMPGSLGAWAW